MRTPFILFLFGVALLEIALFRIWKPGLWNLILVGPLCTLGLFDYFQTRQTIRRNFPLLGRFRYLFEAIRPEINQYFVENNTDGKPFSREQRSVIYQRAKGELDTLPFGTQRDVYETGYEWLAHSINPKHVDPESLRITVGGENGSHPYSASILNISAMSYGSLSKNAIEALNWGAQLGGFAHNTGEGGVSPYHKKPGGDLIWQVGTGYFGCRASDGTFDPEKFKQTSSLPQIKMIEIKISQGAKPGHGGILPGKKVNAEIAAIRGVPIGKDVNSPPAHSAFQSPRGLLHFVQKLRELSGGKPVGFKLCIGKRREFLAICQAMRIENIYPDFITIDGGEGGTGAAPLEFSNHLGSPGLDALIFAHNALTGFSLRQKVRIFATGKVHSAFGIIKLLASGADAVYSARAMMMALGCIQALRCNANNCPTGVATQDKDLVAGLVVGNKAPRVAKFHKETLRSVAEMLGAMGLSSTSELRPWHVLRRISSTEMRNYHELYAYLNDGDLLQEQPPATFSRALEASSPDSFQNPEKEAVLSREPPAHPPA